MVVVEGRIRVARRKRKGGTDEARVQRTDRLLNSSKFIAKRISDLI